MTIHQQKSILKNQQLNRNESKWTRMAETRQKNRQTHEKPNQNMIKNQQNVRKTRQQINKTRL